MTLTAELSRAVLLLGGYGTADSAISSCDGDVVRFLPTDDSLCASASAATECQSMHDDSAGTEVIERMVAGPPPTGWPVALLDVGRRVGARGPHTRT